MKRIIFIALLLLSVTAANAQLSWTTRAGVNLSGIENSDAALKFGWKAGAGLDYSFSKLFSLRPMLYYSTKGSATGKTFSPDETLRLGYLELPVLASFHFDLGQNLFLVANAGPYFGYRISKSPSQTELKYGKFDAGANAGLDFVNHHFVIGIEAQYGFSKLAAAPSGKLHNINYSLVFGYNFW